METVFFFILVSIFLLLFILLDDGVVAGDELPGIINNLRYQGGLFAVICAAEILSGFISMIFLLIRVHMINKSGR